MSAQNGQGLANSTLQKLQGMRRSHNFDLFLESVNKKVPKLHVEDPSPPRKCRRSKYSTL